MNWTLLFAAVVLIVLSGGKLIAGSGDTVTIALALWTGIAVAGVAILRIRWMR